MVPHRALPCFRARAPLASPPPLARTTSGRQLLHARHAAALARGPGGGVIVTPALCLLTDLPYVAVLGTTLASMVPPSLVSMATHHKLGNVSTAAVLPLCLGSAAGAFCGGQLAQHLPSEEPLQLLFAVVIAAMGGHKLRALRGK